MPVEGDGEHSVGKAESLLHAVAVVGVYVHIRHSPEPPQQPHDGEDRVVDLPPRPAAPAAECSLSLSPRCGVALLATCVTGRRDQGGRSR